MDEHVPGAIDMERKIMRQTIETLLESIELLTSENNL